MANKKNIIVCWNNNGYKEILNNAFYSSEDYNIKVFTSFDFFSQLGKNDTEIKKALKDYLGFVVLCELQWNHEKTNSPYLEFQGITFVQRYLRDRLGLKVPVVFTSFLDAKDIISPELEPKLRPDAGIIMTPALQHRFVRLPAKPDELLKPFGEMRKMSDTELVYTQMQYCNEIGFLRQIKHNAEGRNIKDLESFRHQLAFVIDKLFGGNPKLLEDCKQTKEINAFCEKLINQLEKDTKSISVKDSILDPDFVCRKKSEQISILILEDDAKDENVCHFIDFIKEQNEIYKQNNSLFLFREPIVDDNIEEFKEDFADGPAITYHDYTFDVVICDIEIRNREGMLVSLGFNVIDDILTSKKKPIYYIVTNVSRSLYDQIKKESIKRIRLKNEVFGDEERIRTFLYGIKEAKEQKDSENEAPDAKQLFDRLFGYIVNDDFGSFDYNNNKEKKEYIRITSYAELEEVVRTRSLELIKEFLKCFNKKQLLYNCGELENYQTYNTNCATMRKYISDYVGKGNDRMLKDYSRHKATKKYENPTDVELANFTTKLILRRFFLYIRNFVKHYKIDISVEEFKKQYDDKRKMWVNDIACRAISTDCKALKTSKYHNEYEPEYSKKGDNKKGNTQSRCFDVTMLFSTAEDNTDKDNALIITDEERAFLEVLEVLVKNKKNPYLYANLIKIKGLYFNYPII